MRGGIGRGENPENAKIRARHREEKNFAAFIEKDTSSGDRKSYNSEQFKARYGFSQNHLQPRHGPSGFRDVDVFSESRSRSPRSPMPMKQSSKKRSSIKKRWNIPLPKAFKKLFGTRKSRY